MGLTILYTIGYKGNVNGLRKKLEKIRSACLNLPFQEVGEVKVVKITRDHLKIWNYLQNEIGYGKKNTFGGNYICDLLMQMAGTSTGEMSAICRQKMSKPDNITDKHITVFRLFMSFLSDPSNFSYQDCIAIRDLGLELIGTSTDQMIELGEWKEEKLSDNRGRSWKEIQPMPINMVSFLTWAGEGCESSNFSFQRIHKRYVCNSFCKTQYATEFVRCHLLIIKVLDLFKAEGFEVDVSDEGEYWGTRDLSKLAENINDYTVLIKGIFGDLQDAVDKADNGVTLEAPIKTCENYMKVDDSKTVSQKSKK